MFGSFFLVVSIALTSLPFKALVRLLMLISIVTIQLDCYCSQVLLFAIFFAIQLDPQNLDIMALGLALGFETFCKIPTCKQFVGGNYKTVDVRDLENHKSFFH